jgi:hypothetical protein
MNEEALKAFMTILKNKQLQTSAENSNNNRIESRLLNNVSKG